MPLKLAGSQSGDNRVSRTRLDVSPWAARIIERSKAMMVLNRGIGLAIGVLTLGFAVAAEAQENLDQGKSAAQLFASDCAICHKTSAGLSKSHVLGLDSFL